MEAEFIQDCSSSSELLEYFATKDGALKNAGKEIKKAIAALEFKAWFPFTIKNLNSYYFKTQRMTYKGELYAIVTNSAIDYIFKIHK